MGEQLLFGWIAGYLMLATDPVHEKFVAFILREDNQAYEVLVLQRVWVFLWQVVRGNLWAMRAKRGFSSSPFCSSLLNEVESPIYILKDSLSALQVLRVLLPRPKLSKNLYTWLVDN
ncbi:conserved hypothetical protein [Ricinus communis]|uniref:Uncharacterized protein n=1 Tax=Ricinus communis TaxID=3988 RepID=B9STT8_RICCO|nr:conserved hypothetical protein [Ricinus communis]